MLVADLGGAEDIDGVEVEVALLRVVGRLLEQPSPVVRDHLGVGRELEGDVGAVSSVGGGRLLQDVGRLLEQPTPVVGDDGSWPAVLLVGVVAFVEEAAPVVGDYVGSEGSGLGRNDDAPGGLPHGVLLDPPRVELVEQRVEFAEFVEDELGRRRDLGGGIHGASNRESTALVPICYDLR